MPKGKLAHDVTLTPWPQLGAIASGPVTFPAGTPCHTVYGGLGLGWVISSEALVAQITGNTHDAKHRHVFVPADCVEIDA